MKAGIWFGVGVLATLILVAAVLVGGWALWNSRAWGMPMGGGRGMMGGSGGIWGRCDGGRSGWGLRSRNSGPRGPGMMGNDGWNSGAAPVCPLEDGRPVPGDADLTLEEAETAFKAYLDDLGYGELELAEVMEFEYNFYAIAEETTSGIGAMELLLDKETSTVSPEMGPNMMWNAKYGMHGGGGMGMMGGWQGRNSDNTDNALSVDQVLEIAQDWLDANRAGLTVEHHADRFYGYYTLHTERDGEIEGMLSVHGSTGRVWYHTWHGDFIGIIEHDGEGTDPHTY